MGLEALVFGGIAVASMVAVAALKYLRQPGEPSRPWRKVVADCGLRDVRLAGTYGDTALIAHGDDVAVRLEMEVVEEGHRVVYARTRISVSGVHLVPLSLRHETERTTRNRKLADRDIETGDFGFDDEIYLTGPRTLIRAVLDAETRRRLRQLVRGAVLEIERGELRARLINEAAYEMGLTLLLRDLLDLAARLRTPADVPGRLAQNAVVDPVAFVRLENLLTLARNHREHPLTEPALRAGCADRSDDVRVRAAAALGPAGRETLLEVAARDDPDDGCAAQAIASLGRHLPAERAAEILARALRARNLQTARACLFTLARGAGPEALERIGKVMRVEAGELAAAAAQALAMTGLPAAEAPLLRALSRDVPELRVAAAEALGEVGSVQAVVALKETEARHARDGDLRRAARQAIARIQSRAGSSPGQLSLAATSEGALTLTDDERGRLALAGEKPGAEPPSHS